MSRLTEEELVLMENATGAHRWLKLIVEVRKWRRLDKFINCELAAPRDQDELISSLIECTNAWRAVFALCRILGMRPELLTSGQGQVLTFIKELYDAKR